MPVEPSSPDRSFPALSAPIYLSTGHTAHAREHTGIQRVTRSLARELRVSDLRVEFIEWIQKRRRYVILDDRARRGLAGEGGPPFEPIDSLLERILPRAAWVGNVSRREARVLQFEAIFRSIRHPIPEVPTWIDYLPIPRPARRALRRGIRRVINHRIRRRDGRRIRRYVREILHLHRTQTRLTRQILQMAERRRNCEFTLAFMEQKAWRYKQGRDALARIQAGTARPPVTGAPPGEPSERRDSPPPSTPLASDEAELFSLTHRLEPIRFKPVRGAWVVVPELMRPEEMRDLTAACRRHRLNLAVIFHDAIAVTHPELVSESIRRNHTSYMRHLCRADLVLAVSRQSADDLRTFARSRRISLPPVTVCANGASFPGERIPADPPPPPPFRVICVGTIDPRKNHRTLIAALDHIHHHHPSLELQVTLIGNAYAGADDLVREVREACHRLPGLNWTRGVEDRELITAYQNAHFTVFPSLVEGFGLPVLESLWHGRPCICAETGATAESAAGGGCLTIDVTNPEALADAIVRLIRDETLRRRLTNEAKSRVLRTWREQAIDLVDTLKQAVPRFQFINHRFPTA